MNVEIFGEAPLSLKLSEVRRGLAEDFVHLAGELHTPQEYNTRAGGYSVSRSRLLVAPKNGSAETLGEIGFFADAVLGGVDINRWNKDARVYDSVVGKRVLYGKLYAGELISSSSQGGVTVEEHARSIEVVVMPDALLADAAFQISQEKLRGGFNPKNLELALVTESVPFDVFRSGTGALREYAVGISEGLRDYRNGING